MEGIWKGRKEKGFVLCLEGNGKSLEDFKSEIARLEFHKGKGRKKIGDCKSL